MTNKNTVKNQIKDSKGNILQDSKEIIKEYEEYYKQLLKTRKPENNCEWRKEFEIIVKQKGDSRQKK